MNRQPILTWLIAATCASLALPSPVRAGCGPTLTSIRVDGDFGDWTSVLANPVNTVFDSYGQVSPCGVAGDRDCPSDRALDLRRFAYTWDDTHLYFFIERSGARDEPYTYEIFIDRQDEQFFDGGFIEGDKLLQLTVERSGGRWLLTADLQEYADLGGGDLLDFGDFTCGPGGDEPCADGFLPDVRRANYLGVAFYPLCFGCNGDRFIEYEIRWDDLGLQSGEPFAFHVTATDAPVLSGNAGDPATWDNLGGQERGPGSTAYACHEVSPPGESYAAPGESAVHAHVIENAGNLENVYNLTVMSNLGSEVRLHADLDGSGTLTPGDENMAIDSNGDGEWELVNFFWNSDVDPRPDTGFLAPAVGGPGQVFDILVEVIIPPDAPSGIRDTTTLFVVCSEFGGLEVVEDVTHVGRLIAYADQAKSTTPGLIVTYEHVVVNKTGTRQTFAVELESSQRWPIRLEEDPGCNGLGGARLDMTLELDVDEEKCVVLFAPTSGPLGAVDVSTVSISSPTGDGQAIVTDTTTLADAITLQPNHLVANDLAKHSGPNTPVFYRHVLTNNTNFDDTYLVSHSSSLGQPAAIHVDLDCDGRPTEGLRSVLSAVTPTVEKFGGFSCFILELDVGDVSPGSLDQTDLFMLSNTNFDSASAIDETIIGGLATYADPTHSVATTFFDPCETVHAKGFGLERGAVNEYMLSWEEPSGMRVDFELLTPDDAGEITGRFDFLPGDPKGVWSVRLLRCPNTFRPDGACTVITQAVDEVEISMGGTSLFLELRTDKLFYQVSGEDLIVSASLLNGSPTSLVENSAIGYLVLNPAGDQYLQVDGTFAPYTGGEVTFVDAPINLVPGQVAESEFTIRNVMFPGGGLNYTLLAFWFLPCGDFLANSNWNFEVAADPCSGTDQDSDGLSGDCDNCPDAANADQLDEDADDIGDACDPCPGDPFNDADSDLACDLVDNCFGTPNPFQTDMDSDGRGDACDPCLNDPDDDRDADGWCGDVDNCPSFPNFDQADADSDGAGDVCDPCPFDPANDADSDGHCGDVDNCPGTPNPGQVDTDSDGQGNACDPCPMDAPNDDDSDGACNSMDNCPTTPNPRQRDADGDGVGNVCDPCPMDSPDDDDSDGVCTSQDNCPSTPNPAQVDADSDGAGNACDPCPADPLDDSDADGLCADVDNCPTVSNPAQTDTNSDGVGDDCECGVTFMNPPASGPGDTLRADGDVFTWGNVADASDYPVLRGTIPSPGGMASRPVPHDHVCFRIAGTESFTDASSPPADASYYYLVSAWNPCGLTADGYGEDSSMGSRPVPPSCP